MYVIAYKNGKHANENGEAFCVRTYIERYLFYEWEFPICKEGIMGILGLEEHLN